MPEQPTEHLLTTILRRLPVPGQPVEEIQQGHLVSFHKLGKRLFTSAACISHASVSRLAPEEALTQVRDRIAALLETGREDTSGKRALEVLTQAIRAVGSDRARTRPVARLRRELEALRAERETVLAARRELTALAERRQELTDLTADLADRVAETRRRLDAARRAELERILREARQAQAALEKLDPELETLAAYERFPAGEAERLVELKREYDLHREDLARIEKSLEEVSGRLKRLQADLQPLRSAAEMPQNALEVISEEAAHLADAEHRVGLLAEQDRRLAADEEAARRRFAPLENRRRQVQPILDAGEDALAELWRLEEAVETARRQFHEAQVAGENLHVHTLQCREQLERLEPIFSGVTADIEDLRARYEAGQRTFETIRQEIARVVVGQNEMVDGLLIGLFTKGHILIEGVPGIGVVIGAAATRPVEVVDALAASGVRGLRYCAETKEVSRLILNGPSRRPSKALIPWPSPGSVGFRSSTFEPF